MPVGNINDIGLEVIVGGKNHGDRYRIKNNVITMVHRHIHGSLVNIFTKTITDTGEGYLSNSYTSQYLDPDSGNPLSGKNYFVKDGDVLFFRVNPWPQSSHTKVDQNS